jgi:hypothetical protein
MDWIGDIGASLIAAVIGDYPTDSTPPAPSILSAFTSYSQPSKENEWELDELGLTDQLLEAANHLVHNPTPFVDPPPSAVLVERKLSAIQRAHISHVLRLLPDLEILQNQLCPHVCLSFHLFEKLIFSFFIFTFTLIYILLVSSSFHLIIFSHYHSHTPSSSLSYRNSLSTHFGLFILRLWGIYYHLPLLTHLHPMLVLCTVHSIFSGSTSFSSFTYQFTLCQ